MPGAGQRQGARPELLLLADGSLDVEEAVRLDRDRDRRPIFLAE